MAKKPNISRPIDWGPSLPNRTRTNTRQFWIHHSMRVAVGTVPEKHRWGPDDKDLKPVLDNIAAAAHACNIFKEVWLEQCFETQLDAYRFLESLSEYKGHVNSYWFYALLSIVDIGEDEVYTAELLALELCKQAQLTGQLVDLRFESESEGPQEQEDFTLEMAELADTKNPTEAENELTETVQSSQGKLEAQTSFDWVKAWVD